MRGRLAVGTLLAANLVAFAVYTLPAVSEANLLAEHEQTMVEGRERARRRAGNGDSVSRESLDALRAAERRLPSERDLPALADGIRAAAGSAGLELLHADYRQTREQNRVYSDLLIGAVAQGPYRAVKAFLWNLERDSRALALQSLVVKGDDDARPGPRTVRLTIATYLVPGGSGR
ncbi:MAG: type 4a pilus biogenesis protein PilO [Candidatus Wallbacteria bacterium]|nr:type 4a pilus biogenesis protein PilO [Candidatus Wallbacteria bacterium]